MRKRKWEKKLWYEKTKEDKSIFPRYESGVGSMFGIDPIDYEEWKNSVYFTVNGNKIRWQDCYNVGYGNSRHNEYNHCLEPGYVYCKTLKKNPEIPYSDFNLIAETEETIWSDGTHIILKFARAE